MIGAKYAKTLVLVPILIQNLKILSFYDILLLNELLLVNCIMKVDDSLRRFMKVNDGL